MRDGKVAGRPRKYKRRKNWERISGTGSESTGWALVNYVLELSTCEESPNFSREQYSVLSALDAAESTVPKNRWGELWNPHSWPVIDSGIHVPIDLELAVLTSSTCQGQNTLILEISEEAKSA